MINRFISRIGHAVRVWLSELGLAFRTLFAILISGLGLWRRPRLITTQIHFIGNYSLVIILVS